MNRFGIALFCLFVSVGLANAASWVSHDVGTDAAFRGIDVESKKVIWASGTRGTVVRTVDGGKSWKKIQVPGAEKLDFRDIEAFGKNTAYVLSIGEMDQSRIYKTTDGGETWKLQFKNDMKGAFFDSLAFWDSKHGLAQSDPVNGRFVFYQTTDGETWSPLPAASMPEAADGEAAFAASGTSIITRGRNEVFLVTGGKATNVFSSNNRGATWVKRDSPLIAGEAATGTFGIALRGKKGILVGGDYTKPAQRDATFGLSSDSGAIWKTTKAESPFGYRSGATIVDNKTIVVVGIDGSDISRDGGVSWVKLDAVERNSVAAKGKKAIWAVGPRGVVSRLVL
ncbi:MAG: YCF48-related protein [Pyrinomonadaceae bacterium]